MALSGLHVTFSWGSGPGYVGSPLPLLGVLQSSETLASAGTTAIAAPSPTNGNGNPIASLYASVDSWVSIGATPGDPSSTSTTRRFLPAGSPVDWFVSPGDKIRWTAA